MLAGASVWLQYTSLGAYTNPHIFQYQPQRDREAILQLFEENWEWLVAQSPQEYSASYRIDYKAFSKAPSAVNRLSIDVFRMHNATVGFVAYYMKTAYKGFVLFLVVRHAYRGHGIARQLLTHAVEQLRKRGARIIELVTRVDNYSAQRLYERFGFRRVREDSTFITYQYSIGT